MQPVVTDLILIDLYRDEMIHDNWQKIKGAER
jgi:hypothetical protein